MPMPLHDPITRLINTYHELNATVVDELRGEPASIDFLRYVLKNRPFVLRQGAAAWKAVRQWDAAYLIKVMHNQWVNVACTPDGRADAIIEDQCGRLMFVEPYESMENFEDFLKYLQDDTDLLQSDRAPTGTRTVKYAQTQNDNLHHEYSNLLADVPSHVSFATLALGQDPDAVNLWLGNERSTTSLHKDNYENIYVQVRGQKHFVLMPPVEMPCVNESPVPRARYQKVSDSALELQAQVMADAEHVPVPLWDPAEPEARATPYSALSKPMRVTLNEGDLMYLPAMWYHQVSQTSGGEAFSCSVNYWYDMSFEGSFWAQNAFLRDLVNAQARLVSYPDLRVGDKSEDEPDAPLSS